MKPTMILTLVGAGVALVAAAALGSWAMVHSGGLAAGTPPTAPNGSWFWCSSGQSGPYCAVTIPSTPLGAILIGICGLALIAAGIFEGVTGRRARSPFSGPHTSTNLVRIGGAGSLLFGALLLEQALEWYSHGQALSLPHWAHYVQIPGLVGLVILLVTEYQARRNSAWKGVRAGPGET